MDHPSRQDLRFDSEATECAAYFYAAAGRGPDELAPCIVMAHGLGGTREARLTAFAERFAAAGYRVLLFDYRGFGDSAGEPRQVVSVKAQLADWRAAIAFARSLPGVDLSRIVLWGTSFAGGHVVVSAAHDPQVAAIIAQGPMLDGRAASLSVVQRLGLAHGLRLSAFGIGDLLSSALGGSPRYFPLVAPAGELAAMSTPDALDGYQAIVPEGFRNEVAGRIAVQIGAYRPIRWADKVHCPALIQICEHDSVAPASAAEACAARIGSHAEVRRYPVGHFDIYVGDAFERSVSDQLEFLARHL